MTYRSEMQVFMVTVWFNVFILLMRKLYPDNAKSLITGRKWKCFDYFPLKLDLRYRAIRAVPGLVATPVRHPPHELLCSLGTWFLPETKESSTSYKTCLPIPEEQSAGSLSHAMIMLCSNSPMY